jgi:hypothetical protein
VLAGGDSCDGATCGCDEGYRDEDRRTANGIAHETFTETGLNN